MATVNPPIDRSNARWFQHAVFYEVLVRGFYDGGWYKEAYSDMIQIESGQARIPQGPGLGTHLRDSLLRDPGVKVRVSR